MDKTKRTIFCLFFFLSFDVLCLNKVLFPNENYKHQTIGDMCTNVIASESWMEPPKMRQPKMRRLCRRCKKAIQNKHFGGRTNKSPWFICFVIQSSLCRSICSRTKITNTKTIGNTCTNVLHRIGSLDGTRKMCRLVSSMHKENYHRSGANQCAKKNKQLIGNLLNAGTAIA